MTVRTTVTLVRLCSRCQVQDTISHHLVRCRQEGVPMESINVSQFITYKLLLTYLRMIIYAYGFSQNRTGYSDYCA